MEISNKYYNKKANGQRILSVTVFDGHPKVLASGI
jgi:hypothetical protein